MSSPILHTGVVERTDGEAVYVKITSRSACGSCASRQACGLAEAQEKIVVVKTPETARQYMPGESVTVGVRRSVGAKAVMLAYVGALIVLVGMLAIAVTALGWSEGRSALAALAAVALYYGALWLLRNKIDHTINFTITKN